MTAMQAMKVLPRAAVEALIRRALEKQHEINIHEVLGDKDFTGRSSAIVITDETAPDKLLGRFTFVMQGQMLVYAGASIKEPLVTLTMSRDTFESVMCRERTPKDAWEKGLIIIDSQTESYLYHCLIMLRIFDKMRELVGA
jgi:hypothetical protein